MGRGSIVVIASLMVTMFGMLTLAGPTGAQESTPATTEEEIAPGVNFGLIPASEDPPTLYRLRLQPGAALPFAGDPAISLVYVESGALALRMDAPFSDARPDAAGTEDDAGTNLTVAQGDYFVLPPLVAGELRNEGEASASIIVAAITPDVFPATSASTPTAE